MIYSERLCVMCKLITRMRTSDEIVSREGVKGFRFVN